ncbi:hypothetical protein FIBSPDRAFT_403044 [Athelia psychrophila]|uniref:Uncharacterized protein n=1 Tax=Athelia psychrophila TaxID=1759441 RepID=A0A166NIU0_9AGAM|nr:hypothetical protein FIBSPDRAFT_403044 [Fibularhizoctonia sp. CBS 109695]
MNNSASQIIPSDLTVSRWSGYPNLVQSVTGSNSQVWTDSVPGRYQTDVYGYPFIANNDFNVSWSGNVTLDIWATSSDFYGSVDSLPAVYSPGFPLFPFKEYVITLTVINYNVNGLGWLFLEPQIHSAVDSGSNTTTASFSCNWQSQRQTTRRALTSASGLSQFVTAISAIGGIYSFIDVTFALFFGRTILAILFGTRIISPFGLLGVIARNRFRRLIHEQYPYMQEDIDRGGMAAYISEVAIDAGLTRSLESARGRARVSTPSHDSLGPNADPGIMQLGNMEKSKTGDSTGHSLPYV